jgi:hypothetical protein
MMQRRGKAHRAGMGDKDHLSTNILIHFFDECKNALEHQGEPDSAFYFEQMSDYFRSHYSPSKGLEPPSKVLGL